MTYKKEHAQGEGHVTVEAVQSWLQDTRIPCKALEMGEGVDGPAPNPFGSSNPAQTQLLVCRTERINLCCLRLLVYGSFVTAGPGQKTHSLVVIQTPRKRMSQEARAWCFLSHSGMAWEKEGHMTA